MLHRQDSASLYSDMWRSLYELDEKTESDTSRQVMNRSEPVIWPLGRPLVLRRPHWDLSCAWVHHENHVILRVIEAIPFFDYATAHMHGGTIRLHNESAFMDLVQRGLCMDGHKYMVGIGMLGYALYSLKSYPTRPFPTQVSPQVSISAVRAVTERKTLVCATITMRSCFNLQEHLPLDLCNIVFEYMDTDIPSMNGHIIESSMHAQYPRKRADGIMEYAQSNCTPASAYIYSHRVVTKSQRPTMIDLDGVE